MTILAKRRPRLIIMVKEPHPGQVKTRLGQDIGAITAAWWVRHSAARLIRRIRDPRWQVIIAVSPDKEGLQSRIWPIDLMRLPQGPGGLETRMTHLFKIAPLGPTLIIGADIPGIRKHHIERAFRVLGSKEMVFGPAADGGFWLVGKKNLYPGPTGLFKNVRWSSETTLADTLAGLSEVSVGLIETLNDVDTVDDL